ncbi:MAG: PRC-barrel domain-containing protein [Acidobacteriota bacterium]|nr:PRC-barrel domain-containing protein [Acidobacteriota bacterium]
MIRSVQQMRGTGIEAADGLIGEVHDVYFEDNNWIVRYYVVDMGKWLPGRKVLIPSHVIRQTTPDHAGLPVDLTREQIRNSPDVDTDRPISRQAELVLYRHYGWIPYWSPLEPAVPVVLEGDAAEREREATSGHYGGDPNLRSAKDVIGYYVTATDGEIGHIDDFLLDDESAKIRYAVVDTKNWLPGKHVLIAPEWIREIKWSESKVFVNATREAVRNSPEYNPVTPLDREYESRLFTYYGYPVPWL